MRRKEKLITIILWICVAAVAIALGCFAYYVFTKDNTITYVKQEGEELVDTEESGTPDTGYAIETSYAGDTYVPASLFKYPFRKTVNYISNKEYINRIGYENCKILSSRAQEALEKSFNISYSTLERDEYLEMLDTYYSKTNVLIVDKYDIFAEYSEEIADTIVSLSKDNSLVMEAKCYTDPCMVYYDDGYSIVRSKVLYEVYSCTDIEKLESVMGIKGIEPGKPFAVIYETYMTVDVDMSDYASFLIYQTRTLDVVK